jgi:hypothetical protein
MALVHAGIHYRLPEALANPELSESERIQLKGSLEQLNSLYAKWEIASQYTEDNITPKEQKDRLNSFYYYLKSSRELLQKLELAPAFEPTPTPATALKGKVQLAGSFGYLSGQLIVRNSLNLLNYLNPLHYVLPHEWRRSVRRVIFRNSTPFNNNGGISGLFKGFRDVRGYQVELEGKQNLAPLQLKVVPGRKVVNLFLPSHRNDFADAVLMSRLSEEIGSYLLFANPSAFAPNYIFGQMLASIPEFISVGQWRGFPSLTPTDKLLKMLDNQRSTNVINYPQGFISRMGELLPINVSFVQKLLQPLIQNGYEVNVVPISYEVDSTFLSKSGAVDDLHIKAKIHPSLGHSVIDYLVKQQLRAVELNGDTPSARYFDHFLFTLWFENIREHGELSMREMLSRTEKSLGIKSDLND